MIRGRRLRSGDAIRLVAPSGPVPRAELEAGATLLATRYEVRYDPARLFEAEGFLAGPDEHRLAELRAALGERDGCAAVVMARGGYGLTRLLPFLDAAELRAAPKPIVGFSDGTALLAWAACAGVAAIHGPVATQLGKLPPSDFAALTQLLELPAPGALLQGLDGLVPGRARGPLLGGNLEVFSRLLGTPYLPPLGGAILFIEDLGERPYRVDRLITHLDLAGVWSAVAGVVVGDFSGCVEPPITQQGVPTAAQVIEERLGRLTIPVATGALVGHGARNQALPYGTMVELDTLAGTLIALEGVVE